ncbi:hypothetical protein EDD28_0030 [Salana multivorans]|uniref:Uncharacterized protein n=1 Tax=Salana multivorans TaxID=120377 RepID=A0A3N2D6R9_9MICO|nr:hypothetical protein [Salana multivorans]ROR95477.1 hypothetical protein EDD28_0030 [Salana multivorans]
MGAGYAEVSYNLDEKYVTGDRICRAAGGGVAVLIDLATADYARPLACIDVRAMIVLASVWPELSEPDTIPEPYLVQLIHPGVMP